MATESIRGTFGKSMSSIRRKCHESCDRPREKEVASRIAYVLYIDSALLTDLTRMFPGGSSTLTLKQRLTALSQPSSSSSSPRSSPLRRKFSAPWAKRTVPPCVHQNDDSLQSIISKMIYQAGVDYEYTYPHLMMRCNR